MKRIVGFFWYRGVIVRIQTYNPIPAWESTDSPTNQRRAQFHCFGVLFNPKALWIGAHYGAHQKRWCVNILPCLTVWWAKPGGYLP